MKLLGRIITPKPLAMINEHDIYHIWEVNSRITQSTTILQRYRLIAANNFLGSVRLIHNASLTRIALDLVRAVKSESPTKVVAANEKLRDRFRKLGHESSVASDSNG